MNKDPNFLRKRNNAKRPYYDRHNSMPDFLLPVTDAFYLSRYGHQTLSKGQ